MSLFHIVIYGSLLIFIVAILARAARIMRMPLHLRWELQPVPHERPGASTFERVDWWTHSRDRSRFGELSIMIPEILLLKGVWEHNRGLWFASWTLHFGLYLLIGAMVVILLHAVLLVAGVLADAFVPVVLAAVTRPLAIAGGALGTVGAIAMLIRRITEPGMRRYATAGHFVNLVHLGAIYVTALLWALLDGGFVAETATLYAGVLTAAPLPSLPLIGYLNVAIVLLFFIYLPFTHMTHFFTKYFTYHMVRWEDTPNTAGGRLEEKIRRNVSQPVSWSAAHVGANGKKTWLDLVADTGEVKRETEEA